MTIGGTSIAAPGGLGDAVLALLMLVMILFRPNGLAGGREIVGDDAFFELARTIQSERRHGNISTAEFIAFAKRPSGLTGSALDLLDDYFQQWLYGESKPTILPESFF